MQPEFLLKICAISLFKVTEFFSVQSQSQYVGQAMEKVEERLKVNQDIDQLEVEVKALDKEYTQAFKRTS